MLCLCVCVCSYIVSTNDNSGGEKIEEQDKFLGRMYGFMHLFAAIMISSPPPTSQSSRNPFAAQSSPKHPYGVQNAWVWLARISNMEPRPDITATVIHAMLQV